MEKLNKMEFEVLFYISEGKERIKDIWELAVMKPEMLMIIKKFEGSGLVKIKYKNERIEEFSITEAGKTILKHSAYRRWFKKSKTTSFFEQQQLSESSN